MNPYRMLPPLVWSAASLVWLGCSSTVTGTRQDADDAGVSTIITAEDPKAQDHTKCVVSGECESGCCEPQPGNGQGLCEPIHAITRDNPQDCRCRVDDDCSTISGGAVPPQRCDTVSNGSFVCDRFGG